MTRPSFFVLMVFFYLNKKASYQAEIQTENSEKWFNLEMLCQWAVCNLKEIYRMQEEWLKRFSEFWGKIKRTKFVYIGQRSSKKKNT